LQALDEALEGCGLPVLALKYHLCPVSGEESTIDSGVAPGFEALKALTFVKAEDVRAKDFELFVIQRGEVVVGHGDRIGTETPKLVMGLQVCAMAFALGGSLWI